MHQLDKYFDILNKQYPLVYVDVGAMGGVSSYWKDITQHIDIVAFEPDQREFALLLKKGYAKVFPFFLSSMKKDIVFYISHEGGKSSCFKPNNDLLSYFPALERYQTIKVVDFKKDQTTSLDELYRSNQLTVINFMKLDTQGSELDILNGARSIANGIFGIEVEVEFIDLYKEQPLFRDVDRWMSEYGFVLVDLRKAYWKRKSFTKFKGHGQLIFADALYLRDIDHWTTNLSNLKDSSKIEAELIKSCIIALIYGLPDYAIDLLAVAQTKQLISIPIKNKLEQYIIQDFRNEAINWFGYELLAKGLQKLSEIFRPSSHLGFSDGDRFLGNKRAI